MLAAILRTLRGAQFGPGPKRTVVFGLIRTADARHTRKLWAALRE